MLTPIESSVAAQMEKGLSDLNQKRTCPEIQLLVLFSMADKRTPSLIGVHGTNTTPGRLVDSFFLPSSIHLTPKPMMDILEGGAGAGTAMQNAN